MNAEQFLMGREVAMLRSKVGILQQELQWSYRNYELALADIRQQEKKLQACYRFGEICKMYQVEPSEVW